MNTSLVDTEQSRPLGALGISEVEERLYRALLGHPMATVDDIASQLGMSPRRIQRLLDEIESKGLATHSPERPRRYIAATPKLAIEALINQRQATLERARSTIPELTERLAGAAAQQENEQFVELITNRAALGQIYVQIQQTMRKEGLFFQRAPTLFSQGDDPEIPRDVSMRCICDAGFLAIDGALDVVRRDIEMGEDVRYFEALPIKMFVADRQLALIPLNNDNPGGSTLLVRASSLLDALCALFEMTWERATPFVFSRAGTLQASDAPASDLSDAARQVSSLLSAGLNDKAIAYQLGISTATLNRRVAELMKCYSTRTRFQLGWRAALDAFPDRERADKTRKPPHADH